MLLFTLMYLYQCVNKRLGVAAVLRIVEDAGAKVVVTSTWRGDLSMYSYLLRALQIAGIPEESVLQPTLNLHVEGRGAEVRQWLDTHEDFDSCVILDDNHGESFEVHGLAGHFIQTLALDPAGNGECEVLAAFPAFLCAL